MSSLAASRADGYYFPPDYDPEKHGSLNQFRGQHPLRERAKKLDQGILVIRFEMPFNCWCEGCQHLIGKGVRFNAEKQQIGMYHTTRIWRFSMRCPSCSHRIEVETDPKNTEYVVSKGGRRKVETWTAESAETMELPDKEEQQMAAPPDDAFTRLERGESDKRKARDLNVRVAELYHDSNLKYKNDYQMNKLLRRNNREVRKADRARDVRRAALGLTEDVTLLPEAESDALAASAAVFGGSFDKRRREKRQAIMSQSIFDPEVLVTSGPPLSKCHSAREEPAALQAATSSRMAGEGYESDRQSKRARLESIPEDASVSRGSQSEGGRWQMDGVAEATDTKMTGPESRVSSASVSTAWKRDQLAAKSQRTARKDLSSHPVSGKSKKKKKSVLDRARDALKRR